MLTRQQYLELAALHLPIIKKLVKGASARFHFALDSEEARLLAEQLTAEFAARLDAQIQDDAELAVFAEFFSSGLYRHYERLIGTLGTTEFSASVASMVLYGLAGESVGRAWLAGLDKRRIES